MILESAQLLIVGKKTGRPHGLTELEKIYHHGLIEERAQPLASPYLSGPRGLALFESVSRIVMARHSETPFTRERARAVLSRLYALV